MSPSGNLGGRELQESHVTLIAFRLYGGENFFGGARRGINRGFGTAYKVRRAKKGGHRSRKGGRCQKSRSPKESRKEKKKKIIHLTILIQVGGFQKFDGEKKKKTPVKKGRLGKRSFVFGIRRKKTMGGALYGGGVGT